MVHPIQYNFERYSNQNWPLVDIDMNYKREVDIFNSAVLDFLESHTKIYLKRT